MSDHVTQDDQLDWMLELEESDWSLLDALDAEALSLGLDANGAQER